MSALDDLLAALRDADATVATAESLTAGRLAAMLTDPPGASETYRGGFVTYATELKHKLLGVPESVIETVGVVSAECAAAMAAGAREEAGATYGLSTTGVAGPEEQEGKPVGTVFVGISGPHGETTAQLGLSGSRGEIQRDTCLYAVEELLGLLRREHRTVG
ncbi:PncC family amidohydrolase [Nocardioides luteus]|uniref:Competence protein n=1 Tax=Nocardioides luteus TaxID=1844 RepID=A0ABQ5SS94_9ACTN|nr:CinA family protein [Nocardioides luteus]MDR7311135.1 PncC family amidohydrolase [Nocardioides luteus]GGR62517.1 competence protein [Nocardioides luteus]GLJ66681.1 competence protein [Nocardioides luteus]